MSAPARERAGPAGLGLASLIDGLLALAFTIVLARALGPAAYGSLAALVSVFLIGSIAGSALQVRVTLEVSSDLRGGRGIDARSIRGWIARLAAAAVLALALGLALRDQLASAVAVEAEPWAAALVVPAVVLDLQVAIARGVLLGLGRYRPVAFSVMALPAGWLCLGGGLALAGLGVAGAVAGVLLTELAVAALLLAALRRELTAEGAGPPAGRTLWDLVRRAAAPVTALGLFAALHNLDVVAVKHSVPEGAAGAYAAAAVAAKAILWVAIGVAMWLLPEAARARAGDGGSRALLGRALAVVAAPAAAMIALYAAAGERLLAAVFGQSLAGAADALPVLAVGTSLLACAYLAIQLLLAEGRHRFLVPLGLAAALQPAAVALAAPRMYDVALALALVALATATALVALALRTGAASPAAAAGAWRGAAPPGG